MPQRYKLRLGDGRVLAVDSEALGTWAHDRRAMAQVAGTQQWRPLQEVLEEEAAAARLALALIPPKPRQAPTPTPPQESPAPEPSFEPPFDPGTLVGAGPEPAGAGFEPPFDPASLIAPAAEPPGPAFELPDLPSPAPPTPSPYGGSSFAPQEFEAPEFEPPAVREEPERPEEPPARPAFDDEPVSQRYFEASAEPATEAEADLPVIPMKPLEEPEERDDPREFRSAWSDDGSAMDEDDEDSRRGGFDGTTLTALERFGGFLSRILSPLAPAADRLTTRRAKAVEEREEEELEEEPEDGLDEAEELEPAGPSLLERLSAWAGGLRDSFRRPETEWEEGVKKEEDEARENEDAPAPTRAIVPEKAAEIPRPVSELPVVPFKAPLPEPRFQVDQIYGDDEPSHFWSFLEPAWQWLKRIVVTGALVGTVAYAWVERSRWLPRAADLGQSMFSELDKQVLERTRHEERQKALHDVGLKLPQLAPGTIQLVFSRNPLGVEPASEVFQIVREAAERGAATLPQDEQEELRALDSELMDLLSRIEQERIREYDRTRARRVIFPFENPHVMDLVAMGARRLPAERRARLQALLQKAVAAGLELPPVTPTTPPPR